MDKRKPALGLHRDGKLKKTAVPSLRRAPDHGVPIDSCIDMFKMIRHQQHMEPVCEPETDPLAVNETDLQDEQIDDSNYREQKVDIEELQCPPESVDGRGDFQTSERDPLEISDVQFDGAGHIKQEDCSVAVKSPEAASQQVGSPLGLVQERTGQISKTVNISMPEASTATSQSSIQERMQQGGKSVDVAMPEVSSASSVCLRKVQITPRYVPCVVFNLVTKKPFCDLNPIEKRQLVKAGRPMPVVETNVTIRGNVDFLSLYKLYGWLAGSEVFNKLYCWPCLLFSKVTTAWNCSGFGIVKNVCDECDKHERSKAHIRSNLRFTKFGNLQNDQDRRLQVWKIREILPRLIDAVCILAEVEMPKLNDSVSEMSLQVDKVYLEIINMFSEYDEKLKSHLQTVDGNIFSASEMRKDLIDSISCTLINEIKQEVEGAKFVSIICGEMSEMKHNPPLASVVLRYVNREGTVRERFIGYFKCINIPDKTSKSYIIGVITEFKLADKLVSLSNDSQQGRLRCFPEVSMRCLSLLHVHSFSHSLNLALKQDCLRIKECRLFISMLSSLAAFFSTSSEQRNELESFLSRKLPTFTPTMLNFTSRLEHTVFEFLPQLLEFFQNITDNPEKWDESSVVSALGFKAFFRNVQNIFLTHLFATLFKYTDMLYEVPEELEFTNYSHCATQLNTVKFMIQSLHGKFEKFWDEIVSKAAECDRNQTINPPQSKKISGNTTPSDCKRLLREIAHQIFAYTADSFASIEKLKFFDLLDPKYFETLSPSPENLKLISKTYPNIFNVDKLKSELTTLYGIEDFRGKLPQQYISNLQNLTNANEFVEVYKLVCLYLTIPCTQVSSEPSFLALNRIKCVREMMGQHPASNLAVMTIENQLLTQMKKLPDFYTNVTNEFAKLGRKAEFTIE